MFKKRNRFNTERKKKNPLKLIFVVIIFLSFLVLSYFLTTSFFQIKQLEVKGELSCVTSEDFKNSVGIKNQNLFTFNKNSLGESIKKFPCLKEVVIKKDFPDKLTIELIRRNAVFLIITNTVDASNSAILSEENESTSSAESSHSAILNFPTVKDGDKWLVDEEGVVFGQNQNVELFTPVIYTDREVFLGFVFPDNFSRDILLIVERLKEFGLNYKALLVESSNFYVDSVPKVVFSLNENLERQLASLQLILEKAKIENENIEFIDLRFDKPIVKYGKK